MTEFVVIRLGAGTDNVEWVHVNSDGTRLSGVSSGTLETAASDVGERKVIVLVPAIDVLTTSTQIPVRSSAKIRAALPFALEEVLAEDIDTLHFAAGQRQDDDQIPVAVVAEEKLRAWLTRLADAGIEAAQMVPENHGLAIIPGTMSLLIDDHCTMFNDGATTEFVMQNIKPTDLLAATGYLNDESGDDEQNQGHLMVFCSPQYDDKYSHDWLALRHELDSVDVNVLPDGVLPKLAVTVANGRGVNLLQGAYGKKSEYSSQLRPWKTAAMLLLALSLVGLSSTGIDYFRLKAERNELREQFSAEYQTIRPGDDREIADPVKTVESLKRSLGTTAAPQVFLPSLSALGSALNANSKADIELIDYRAGVINIRLTAPDVATLDRIEKEVSSSGRFVATIQSAEKVADRINGRIQIRESGL